MRITALTLLILFSTSTAIAFDDRIPVVQTIAILTPPAPERANLPEPVDHWLPRYLEEELDAAGFEAVLIESDLDAISERHTREPHDLYVSIAFSDAAGGTYGGIGTAGDIGSVDLGGEIAIVRADVIAEIRLYSGATLEELESFELRSRLTAPTVTGVGLGGRHSWAFVRLPYLANAPLRKATRKLAKDAAERIAEQYRSPEEAPE